MIIDPASARVLKANVSGSLRLGVFLTAAMASLAYGQTILIDDFNDGNDDGWKHIDLIADAPHGPAIFDASSREYRLTSTHANEDPRSFNQFGTAWNASVDPLYSNGFLRTTIRINEPFAGGSLTLRVSGLDSLPSLDALNMYRFSAFYNAAGETASGFVFDRFEAGEVTYSQFAQLGGFTLDEDWMLEAGVVGGELSMKF